MTGWDYVLGLVGGCGVLFAAMGAIYLVLRGGEVLAAIEEEREFVRNLIDSEKEKRAEEWEREEQLREGEDDDP
ncbi:MAG: hypothetical protein V3T84_11080 [Phycisphaerales bacterium]